MESCKGKTRTGAACRAPAGSGGLCFFHANPNSVRSLGQIGGRKNRRSIVDLLVPDNMTAADVCNVTAQAIRLLLSGNMHAREAGALAQLCNSLYRFIPTADLEARVTMLEEQFVQEGGGNSQDHVPAESPADRPETGEIAAQLEVEQHTQCSANDETYTGSPQEDGAENTSHGSNEADEEA
jgi:hypothetical protein